MSHEYGRPARTARAKCISWSLTMAAAVVGAGCNDAAAPPSTSRGDRIERASPTTAPTADNPAVARINGLSVTRNELDQVLYRAYGINMLAELVELDLARQALAQKGLVVTEADVTDERRRSMEKLFPADKDKPENFDQDFKQFKAQQHVTDAQFDLALRTTATLRKVAHPQVAGQVSDGDVRKAFGILYGENRRIADVELTNVAEAAEAHRRLTNEPFEMVAREMSLDKRTAEVGGHWPPFSTKTPGVPSVIMEAAFSLKVGEVSHDAIVDGDRFHVIKLLEVIPPKLVNYDDVKAEVRRQVEDQVEQAYINQLRKQLQQLTLQGLEIDDPTLKGAWDAMIAAQQPSGRTMSPGEAVKEIHAAERPTATKPAAP